MLRLLLALSLSLAAAAQEEPTLRVDVRLVHVLANVKDVSGQPVGSLPAEAFTLEDNGVRQKIAVFERSTGQPLSVSILVDNSGSTAKDLRYEVDSVARFIHSLLEQGDNHDTVALYGFNDEVTRLNGFTRNSGALSRSLHGMRGSAGTSLYDAIYLAAGEMQDREGRHVMLIITDGGDTTSRKDYQAALAAAQRHDIVLYSILVVPIENDAGRNRGGENALSTLAASTGGHVFAPTLGTMLDQALSDVLRDLRTQYYIGYYPQNIPLTRERFHRIRLTVDQPELRISARSGYYGDADPSGVLNGDHISVAPRGNHRKDFAQE